MQASLDGVAVAFALEGSSVPLCRFELCENGTGVAGSSSPTASLLPLTVAFVGVVNMASLSSFALSRSRPHRSPGQLFFCRFDFCFFSNGKMRGTTANTDEGTISRTQSGLRGASDAGRRAG